MKYFTRYLLPAYAGETYVGLAIDIFHREACFAGKRGNIFKRRHPIAVCINQDLLALLFYILQQSL